jgi:DNA-binding NarL/FixJ family response regulator
MRILLADNRRKVRFALRALLERQSGVEIVGEAVGAEDLLARAQESCPDLVLLDWELPGMAADDLLFALRQACPAVLVVALSGRVDARRAAVAAGVDAFVSKGEPPERLLSAIECCAERCSGC